ncbi:hypothetical protein Tsubulata_051031 [Turnera subulata]|uniref:Uncharacterized protein n=1 Tax=Turnera subulata TaxID=218843 RepID=A0A9Q0FPB0_9ROSI|nr:hypothetical protein Tsubulata_051031 [Turnera subulata]
MEESKPVQDPPPPETPNPNPNPNPPITATQPPAPPPPPPLPPKPPAAPSTQNESRKRRLDATAQIQESSYYKMRAIVKEIRPHILQILRTPDFQGCKEAHEVQESKTPDHINYLVELKLLVELCNQMTAETVSNSKTASEGQPFSVDNEAGQKQQGQVQEQAPEHGESLGKFIVGGSAFGWNFITSHGDKPVYYGRTKESFRSTQATS